MLNQENLKIIKETAQEFFKKMAAEAEITVAQQEEPVVSVSVTARDPQILIGENGQTLMEIQQLLKIILRKKINEQFFLDVDINDYKKGKSDYLKKMVQQAVDEVITTNQEKWLPVMPAYERRIVHMELTNRADVAAESVGEEPERRIIIKPVK